jgi:hypothetical protein
VSPSAARRLVGLALAEDGTVRDDAAVELLRLLSRSDLKAVLGALRRELRRRTVVVEVAGDVAPARRAAEESFAGRSVDAWPNPGLGAGVRFRAGDDIVDASVRGAIRRIIAELGST